MWSLLSFLLMTAFIFMVSRNKNTPNSYDCILYNGVKEVENVEEQNVVKQTNPNGKTDSSVEKTSLGEYGDDGFSTDDVLSDSTNLIDEILGG